MSEKEIIIDQIANWIDVVNRMDESNKHMAEIDRWITITNSYNKQLKDQIEKFIQEATENEKVLQAEINALMNAPWYKLITKNQKANILGTAIVKAKKEFKETLDKMKKG